MADQALMRAVLTHMPYRAIQTADITKLRIGVCRTPNWGWLIKRPKNSSYRRRATWLKGASIADFDLPDGFHEAIEGSMRFPATKFRARLRMNGLIFRICRATICAPIGYQTVQGLSGEYQAGLATLGAYRTLCRIAEGWDVLITPSACGSACRLDDHRRAAIQPIWTGLYGPAINLPLYTGPNGLPIGHKSSDIWEGRPFPRCVRRHLQGTTKLGRVRELSAKYFQAFATRCSFAPGPPSSTTSGAVSFTPGMR